MKSPSSSLTALSAGLIGRLSLLALIALSVGWPLSPQAGSAAEFRDPRAHFFTQSFGDLPEELEEARQAGKIGLMLFFEQDGCPYCDRMMKTILNRPEVQDWYRERFVIIAVDINGDVELRDVDGVTLPSKAFAAHRRVKTTPTISFIDLNGAEVYRRVKMVGSVDEFMLMGRYVAEGHYTDTRWQDFATAGAGDPQLPHVLDFREAGAEADGRTLLLAVTREGCPYCAQLRREVLAPMIVSGEYSDRLLIREMMMEPDTAVVDFDGQENSTSAVAARYGVSITPTVLLLSSSGQPLASPIVGINSSEMYGHYLDQAIATAASAVAVDAESDQE
jgi:thioredoxin-related protein